MAQALVFEGRVVEIAPSAFPVSPSMTWHECSNNVAIGWAYENGVFTPPSVVISPVDVIAERTRRLALGFHYDFGTPRGVHHIGTTSDDMIGWREVIDYANALMDLGQVATQIAIVTNTGPTLVTAPEWQAVMLASAHVRQTLWAKSFELQAMSPIPSDYTNDRYWS